MSTVVTLADARARGINLPADDDVAQDILDEQEALLAGKIGALTGSRTETFYVGISRTHGKLGLARFTDAVTLTDGGATVDADHLRLIDRGSAVVRSYESPIHWWTGPYVAATYTPNDEERVRSVLYDFVGLAAEPAGPYNSERLGDYSYTRSLPGQTPAAIRAALIASLLPPRDSLMTVYAVSRPLDARDPVINRPESPW